MGATTLVWLRGDLRLADHPALFAAAERGRVIVAHVHDRDEGGSWREGAASRVWKHHALDGLARSLARRHAPLVLRRGRTSSELARLAKECGADSVFANRRWEPWAQAQEKQVAEELERAGVETSYFHGVTLRAPDEIRTGAGGPFKVFTPFWRALVAAGEPEAPLPEPEHISSPPEAPPSLHLDELGLLPDHSWAESVLEGWSPGERGALDRLELFVEGPLAGYAETRDQPAEEGVSRLSPHLHHGELSPRQVWHALRQRQLRDDLPHDAVEPFLRQIGWREFAHALLWHFPHTSEQPFNERFAGFPWAEDQRALRAWQRGRTGYPLVDAGMRQLWQTGWMHNRVRMIVGSFLVKHLLLDWRLGERWFRDTLVDCDPASNVAGWQWVAGSGADAAPYFRIFNPILQGEKFDKDGDYVKLFVPELVDLPSKYIHKPWEAPAGTLRKAGVTLGETYPKPIVDHKQARERALSAYQTMREEAA